MPAATWTFLSLIKGNNVSTFGDIERTFADLYEYRWAIGAGVLVFLAAVIALGYWRGWHLAIWRQRLPVTIVAPPLLAVTLWLGWSLGSSLFTNVTVEEEFPFAFNAIIPAGLEMGDVQEAMAGMAKVQQQVIEAMPNFQVTAPASEPSVVDSSASSAVINEPDRVILLKGLEMVKEATEKSDGAMMNQGLEMMTAAIATIKVQPDMPETVTGTVVQAQAEGKPAQQMVAVALKLGSFMDAESFHKGSGSATIYRGPDGSYLLRLEDLAVTNGPDLHVILSPHASPDNPGDVKTAGYLDLGRLKGNRGNQNYEIPDDVEIGNFRSVVIYCVPFIVVFSVAMLDDLTTG